MASKRREPPKESTRGGNIQPSGDGEGGGDETTPFHGSYCRFLLRGMPRRGGAGIKKRERPGELQRGVSDRGGLQAPGSGAESRKTRERDPGRPVRRGAPDDPAGNAPGPGGPEKKIMAEERKRRKEEGEKI